MHLVLDGGKEVLGNLTVQGVVDRRGIDVSNFLIESALTGSDLLNLGNQVVEVGNPLCYYESIVCFPALRIPSLVAASYNQMVLSV